MSQQTPEPPSERAQSDQAGAHEPDLDGDAPPAVDPAEVLAAITDESRPLPFERLHALSAPDDALTGRLLQLWGTLSVERRRELLASFQRLSADDATLDFARPHLSALLDSDAATRILAMRGLWEYEQEAFLHVLMDMLSGDPEGSVRAEAAQSLGRFVVSMEFDQLTDSTADRLQLVLRDVLEDVNEEDEVRGQALEALGASSEEWVAEQIVEHYDGGSVRMRVASLRAMGRNAADEWLPILLHNFEDPDADVRAAAAQAAGELLLEDAIAALIELIGDDESEVRVAAVRAVGEIAGDAAEAVLLDLVRGTDPELSAVAEEALQDARLPTAGPGSVAGGSEAAGDDTDAGAMEDGP